MKANRLNKKLGLMLAFLFCAMIGSSQQNLADSAQKAYEKLQYKQAITYYERILAEGESSAFLYYNLGNAYFKDNQLGKAIYNYEQARKLNPGDEDIRTNLRIANSKTVDKIESKENYLAGAIKSGVFGLFSTTGWAWLSICVVIFVVLCSVIFVVSQRLFVKRLSFWFGLVGAVSFVVVFSIGYAAVRNIEKKTQAIVTSQVVQVLNAPNESGKSKFSLHEGTKIGVLNTNDEWTSVQLANGNEGWIRTKDLGLF